MNDQERLREQQDLQTPLSDLERRLRDHVAAGSGLLRKRVFSANSKVPEPNELFGTLMLVGLSSYQPEYREYTYGGVYRELLVLGWEARLHIQWMNAGSQAAMLRFAMWAKSNQGKEAEQARGFTLGDRMNADDLDIMVERQWHERWGLRTDIGFLTVYEEDTGRIACADIYLNPGTWHDTALDEMGDTRLDDEGNPVKEDITVSITGE